MYVNNHLFFHMDILQILDLLVNYLNLYIIFLIRLLNLGEFDTKLNLKYSVTLYIMFANIRKFISNIFHNIRLIFHQTHCESDGGLVACECDNHAVSTSSSDST